MKAVVLGCGLVGGLIAADLSSDFEVTVIDVNAEALKRLAAKAPVKTVLGSAVDPQVVGPAAAEADVVCGAVPGRLGYQMLKMLIELGKNAADISFMPEDFLELDGLAKERGVSVVPDFGVAPGMCHFLVGRGAHLLDEVEDVLILVGGIPKNPKPPFNFKIVFSAEDVIDEFLRPVRYVKDGRLVTTPAASGLELIEFPGVGVLEAFYTDGLRSLVKTIKAKNLAEKTLRWPGHAEMMVALREMGLFGKKPRILGGVEVTPFKVTADLLFPVWEMKPEAGDRDMTIMKVVVNGKKDGDMVTYTWYLEDYFDEATWYHSMARTTGFPCAAMARAIAQGMVKEKGVIAPELLAGDDELFDFLMTELSKRGVNYTQTVEVKKERW